MKHSRIYGFAVALMACNGIMMAQSDYTGRVKVEPSVVKAGPDVKVRLDMTLDSVDLKAQHALVLTPVLQSADGQTEKELAPVIVNGRIRQKVYDREIALGYAEAEAGPYAVVRRKNDTSQQLDYEVSVPYERWMRGASLVLREEAEGCASCQMSEYERPLCTVLPVVQVVEPAYAAVYVEPRAEEVKRRDEQCELHLNYRVGRSEVLPNLSNNQEELKRLQDMADRVEANNDFTLTGFRITGYASPEGSYKSNMTLSERRAKALADYFRRTNNWDRKLFSTDWKGEDWEGLRQAVEASALDTKDQVLAVIREEDNPDARDAKLRAIDGGKTYNTLLKDFYPPLRRSFCVVDFTVRPYTLEEAKRIINENPKLLSLKEMYGVAKSYPEGSPEYNEAFLTAQRLYSNDADAATNAAAVWLAQGKTAEAKAALQQVEQTAGVCNALGIIYAREKDYARAEELFGKAAAQGCTEAKANLEAMQKYVKEFNENNY